MKEKKKIELKNKLDKLAHLFMMVKESYLYAEYFHNPDTDEERAILNDSLYFFHFRFICHILFKNSIIELAKLFGRRDSDKFRLTKFIDGFKKDGQYGDFGINKELINEWEMKMENHKNSIDFIIKLRDELYAHTDEKEFDYNLIDLSFSRIKELIDFSEEIIKHFYFKLFNTDFNFESPKFDRSRFLILKVLAIGEEKRKADIVSRVIDAINRNKINKR